MKKRVIKLTESQLNEIIKRVISEQKYPSAEQSKFHRQEAERLLSGTKPAEGGKYCFTKEKLIKTIENGGAEHLKLYRIKSGETLGKYQNMTDQKNFIISVNNLCDLKNPKGFRAGDVIAVDFKPSH